jgi:XTP/dITP diphosphohydrolase
MIIYLASGNAHKLSELRTLLSAHQLPVEVESAVALGGMPEVDETAPDFHGNADLKADALLAKAPSGAWVLADDSGLQVDALHGAPGVYSARFAGPSATDASNNEKLLRLLQGESNRAARFVCVLCLKSHQATHFFAGCCSGVLLQQPSGSHGFGYDPLFQPDGFNKSFAELGESIKSQYSHRAKAVAAFVDWLRADLA